MKKKLVLVITVLVVALIVVTLFSNRAAMEKKAKIVAITSYPVSVVTAAKQKLDETFSQVGVIVSNNDVEVASELQGKVTAVYVKEGSHVSPGSPLVKVDDMVPEANYASAKSSYEKALNDWKRMQGLYQDGLISKTDLETSQQVYSAAEAGFVNAKRQYQNSIITSSISGIVTARPVNIGTMVNNGMVVATVIDNSLFKVQLNIAEQYAFKLRVGDPVGITSEVYPGIQFQGRIDTISAKADAAHTYPVQILLANNKQYPLKSGMFGTSAFTIRNQDIITIPRESIIGSVKSAQVYIVEDGIAKLRSILVSTVAGTVVGIKQGLREGEVVVVNGQNNLQDNARVEIVKN
jgi:RND family efflux transporter MFP subunit